MLSMIKLAVLTSATYPENQLLLAVAKALQSDRVLRSYDCKTGRARRRSRNGESRWSGSDHDPARAVFLLPAQTIADLALKHQLPLAMSEALAGDAGALLRINPDVPGCAARSATYVDHILKGAKPGDLAVERYGNKQLVINLKTAKTLGMNVDLSALQGAKIIE